MPKAVFHAPPEDEEEEHVPEEVQPSPMEEHGNKDGDEKSCDGQVSEPVPGEISRRDDSKEENQPVDVAALCKFKEEDPNIRDDDGESNKPEAPPPDVVGEGKGYHKPIILHGEGHSTHGKSESGQKRFRCQKRWRTGDAARHVGFQILSRNSQCAVLLIEKQDFVRVSEVNLNEGHGPVRSGVVNNRIAVVGVAACL